MAMVSDLFPAAALAHGGDLGGARRMFPGAPEPFLDLSTGINPFAYPVTSLAPETFTRLPEPAAALRLAAIAAQAYGAPSASHVVSAPGTQILLPRVASLLPPGRAAVLGPTYAEHARAAALAGHGVVETADIDRLAESDLAVVVNPNNPDGRIVPRERLLALAATLRAKGGLLVVDEAFMDVGPAEQSLCGDVNRGGIVVLRSFGKFFGLAGLRLGFAVAAPDMAARLDAALGPWAIAGPALAIGSMALADRIWAAGMRRRLHDEAAQLDGLLTEAALPVVGGTTLYRLVESPAAAAVFEHLGRNGILVRRFAEHPTRLRFGLPPDPAARERLRAALSSFGDHGA